MRSRIAIVNHRHTLYGRSSGISDQRIMGTDTGAVRCSPIICDQHHQERFLLPAGESKTLDFSNLELTTGLNVVATGPFKSTFILADQGTNQDTQEIAYDGILEWATDGVDLVEPKLYSAKHLSSFQGTTFYKNAFFQMDPYQVPTINQHSYVVIDFNKLVDWSDSESVKPAHGIIRISAVLNQKDQSKFDYELELGYHEDIYGGVFAVGTTAASTADSFERVWNVLSSPQTWTEFSEEPYFGIANNEEGVIVIWSRVCRPQQDVLTVYGATAEKARLEFTFSGVSATGKYFTLDVPGLGLRDIGYPSGLTFTSVADAATPNFMAGEFRVGTTSSEAAENLAECFNARFAKENSPYGQFEFIGTAEALANKTVLTAYFKGRTGWFVVDGDDETIAHEATPAAPGGGVSGLTNCLYQQILPVEGRESFEGDILVNIIDNTPDISTYGWLHETYGRYGWKWGIEKTDNLPLLDANEDFVRGVTSTRDPAFYFFPDYRADCRINRSYSDGDPYVGSDTDRRGIKVVLGGPRDSRVESFGKVDKAGLSTALVLAPNSGSVIYNTLNPITGVNDKTRFKHAFMFVNHFMRRSSFFPYHVYVPLGTDQAGNMESLMGAIKSLFTRFYPKTVTVPEFDQPLYGGVLYANDMTLSFDESYWSIDYSTPRRYAYFVENDTREHTKRHIIGIAIENPNLVDIYVDVLAIGLRVHSRGYYHMGQPL